MSRPRPSAFAPGDRLVGVAKPPSQDEIDGCNDPKAPWHQKDVSEFERVWCSACKNTACIRSKGSKMPWVDRMMHQPDYLINDPIFSDLLSHAHRVLAGQDFQPRNAQAERLEIASARQDWTIPEPEAKLIHPEPVPAPASFDDPPEELEELPEIEPEPLPLPAPPPPPPPQPPPKQGPRLPTKKTNTPMPKGGLLVGPPPPPPVDPWTPTNQTIVQPGAKIVLK